MTWKGFILFKPDVQQNHHKYEKICNRAAQYSENLSSQ